MEACCTGLQTLETSSELEAKAQGSKNNKNETDREKERGQPHLRWQVGYSDAESRFDIFSHSYRDPPSKHANNLACVFPVTWA